MLFERQKERMKKKNVNEEGKGEIPMTGKHVHYKKEDGKYEKERKRNKEKTMSIQTSEN